MGPVRRLLGAERTSAALLSALAFCLLVAGTLVLMIPAPGRPALAAAAVIVPPTQQQVTVTASQPLPGYGVPHRVPPVTDEHAGHEHHLAVVAARQPPPAVTVVATTPAAPVQDSKSAPSSSPTPTPTPSPTESSPVAGSGPGAELLAKAETMQGVPYVYGGDTPSGFDCSGLIYWAAQQLGITGMPRDTYEMLAAVGTVLEPVSDPQPGDLVFFGSGHVELYVRAGETFGAQSPGTVVGFHSYGYGYAPSAFYRVV